MKQMIERRDGCFNRKLDLLQVIQCMGSRVLLDVVVLPGLCPVPNSITKSQSELEVRIKNVHQVVRPFKIFSSEHTFAPCPIRAATIVWWPFAIAETMGYSFGLPYVPTGTFKAAFEWGVRLEKLLDDMCLSGAYYRMENGK